jgi:tetratricopeptide (TPR) repeat protein
MMRGPEKYYRALGLPSGADRDAVRSAYRRLARRYHPDAAGSDSASLRAFLKITEAYHALIDILDSDTNANGILPVPSREEIAGVRRMALSTLMLNRLALSYMDEGSYDDAARILDRLIQKSRTPSKRRKRSWHTARDFRIDRTPPGDAAVPLPETSVNRAYLSFLFDRVDHAVEELLSARILDGDDLSIAHNLSLMYRKQGRFFDAARIVDEMAWEWEERLAFFHELDGMISFLDRKNDVVGYLRRVVAGKHKRVSEGKEDTYIIKLLTDS